MSVAPAHKPIVHFVGSIPLPDTETVFRTLAAATGRHLKRLPDGETGIRKTWIRFLQQVLADNPAIEVASDVPPLKFTQWDGKLLREIPRLRVKPGARLDPATVKTGYAEEPRAPTWLDGGKGIGSIRVHSLSGSDAADEFAVLWLRNRWFADSPPEGTGFELLVRGRGEAGCRA